MSKTHYGVRECLEDGAVTTYAITFTRTSPAFGGSTVIVSATRG